MENEYYLFVLIGVLLVASFTIDHYLVYGELSYEWNVICELTNLEPYYDCPEEIDGYFDGTGSAWLIISLNTTVFTDMTGQSVYGYAVHTMNPTMPNGKYNMCSRYPELNTTKYMDIPLCSMNYTVISNYSKYITYEPYHPMLVIEHELKHLKCKCNWHLGLWGKAEPIVIGIDF